MRTVYLDNNVLVDIENGIYSTELFLNKTENKYYYSQSHIGELLEAKNNHKVSHMGRLNLIGRLCGKNYILPGGIKEPEFFDKKPSEMYDLIDKPSQQYISQVVSQLNESFEKVRKVLGFDIIQFNNVPPEQVLNQINDRMIERLGRNLISFLLETESESGRALYYTLLQIVDMSNYWGDRKTEHSNVARLYDASHAYFAQICDVLVTNDKKMRKKIKAIYSFLNINTAVLSVDEFMSN